MAIVHQSDLSSFDRCAHAYSLARAGNQGTQTSALAYGTVIHYALLNVFEREYRTGTAWATAMQMAIDSFKYYWSPLHIEELTEPVELWLPRQTFGALLAKGVESIRWYGQAAREEESQVIATEIGFQVPIKGTWDENLGEPHILAGTIDILKVKPIKRTVTLSIDDLKGLALDTPIPTPGGWTSMAVLQAGDQVFGSDGKPYPVTAKSEVHWRDCYRITFDDASSIVVDADHRWVVHHGEAKVKTDIFDTKWLSANLRGSRGQRDKRIRNAQPLTLPDADLPIHPYVLGAWLGDGKHSTGELTKPDADFWQNIIDCGYRIGISTGMSKTVLGLMTQLRGAGLLCNKRIPEQYLRASLPQRLSLLQGLMDTDGSWNRPRRQAVFTSTDKGLAAGVLELVLSLGWRGLLNEVERHGFGKDVIAYDVVFTPVDMNPFRLPRKADLVDTLTYGDNARARRRLIVSIEPAPTVPTQCISVGSPDETYLAGHQMVPTHNSGKDYSYLRQNLQFTAYTYATTCKEFWTGWRGEDGFGPQGEELYRRFVQAPRRASWISLKSNKVMDAGWRGPDDWARFAIAVEQFMASVNADIFPLSINGENCQYCFTGDTRYWTADGLRTFAETAGTTQRVLSNTGSGGYWVEAPIRRFATDEPVLTVRMARGRAVQEVRATPDHRWLVRVRNDESRTQSRVVTTSELRPGDRLHALLPSATRLTKVTPSWVGIAAGIVFGDGCSPVSRDASKVTLWGDKCALSQYFPGVLALPVVKGDLKGLQIHSLPRFMKEVPSLEESASYLYGWLAGYFATDGSVGTNGQVSMSSANRAHLELVQAVAARLGIGTHNIASADRVGLNGVTSALYRLNFMTSSLREDFFLLDKHQERFRPEVKSTITWTVTDVVDEGQREDVYCATVPEYENFTLEGFVNVMNCSFRSLCAGIGVPASDHGAP